MRWNVEGVDGSGKGRVFPVDAETAQEAEAKVKNAGVKVAAVHRSVVQPRPAIAMPPPPPPDAIDYAQPHQAPPLRRVPDYRGLKLGSVVLSCFSVLSYFGGAAWLLIGLIGMSSATSGAGVLTFGLSIGPAFACFVTGAFLQTLSAGALALRDLARNSFR